MKILLFVMIAFLISCASSTSLKPANSPDNSLKVMEKADLDERKEVVAEEIRSAILVQSETSTIALASADDPFFQQLKRNESVQVKRPAKALTEYVSMEIWTVQLASFTDETNATKLKTELDQNYKFPVRISTENGIYKVRMGAYEHRNEADQLVYDLKKEGYNSAWVTKDIIRKVKNAANIDDPGPFFYLQIGNFSSELYAQKMEKEFALKSNERTYIKRANGFYKVLLGKTSDRDQLNSLKEKLSQIGYSSFVIQL